MSSTGGRAIAAVGVVLAFVCVWVDALPGASYWNGDGTTAAFSLAFACLAALLFAAGLAGLTTTGALFAVGAVMLGFYGFIPAVLAVSDWEVTEAGTWLAFVAGALIVIGAGISYLAASPADTPAGLPGATLVTGLGIVLLFPGIFLDEAAGVAYWDLSGHSLGVVMLVLAIGAGLGWGAAVAGVALRGLDQAVSLVLLGLFAFVPVDAAFQSFGNLDEGAWLALAGAILAAGGTWAARGAESPSMEAAAT